MPGTCKFKRFGDEWVLQEACKTKPERGDCPAIPQGQEVVQVSKADINKSQFLESLKAHLGADFAFAAEDEMELPCTGSPKPGSYRRKNGPTLLTFNKYAKAAGKISGILEVTVIPNVDEG